MLRDEFCRASKLSVTAQMPSVSAMPNMSSEAGVLVMRLSRAPGAYPCQEDSSQTAKTAQDQPIQGTSHSVRAAAKD